MRSARRIARKVSDGLQYGLLQKKNAVIGVEGEARYLAPASTNYFTIKSGYAYEGGVYLMQAHSKNDGRELELHLDYGVENQDTSIATKAEPDFTLMLLYHWGIKW